MRSPNVSLVRAGAALLASVALLASCDSKGGPVSPAGAPAGKRGGPDVRASRADAVMMVRTPSAEPGARGGTTLHLDAGVFNPQGKELEHKKHVYWTSSDTSVATVDDTGLVTAQDTGEVAIVVDHKKGVDTVHILVIPVPVKTVTVAGADSISLGDAASYTAAALDSVGEPLFGRPVEWSSTAPAVASVSAAGEVVALDVGTAEIVAAVEGVEGMKRLRVWPQPVATVEVVPDAFNLPQFRKTTFRAIARDRRGNVLADRPATWTASDTAVFGFKANTDTLVAKDVGTAVLTVTVEGKTAEAGVTVTNPVEARALWITRFEYTGSTAVDFPKIATIMQKAASANFNVVYFQVRTAGDALYFSELEPCSPRMCGTLGGPRPSRDPLEVALAEAAKYGIEVHAWINAYSGWISGSTAACSQLSPTVNPTLPEGQKTASQHWLRTNPEWQVVDQFGNRATCGTTMPEYVWMSPGVPQVRARVAQVAADIATRYGPKGLKGIHLDRIRYPAAVRVDPNVSTSPIRQWSWDPTSLAAFGSTPTTGNTLWANQRRAWVNQGVKEIHDAVRSVNPAMVLSAAVFPGYQPRTGWSAEWSFSNLYQDPQAWAQGGYLDVELPMNYPAAATSASWTVKAYCSNTDWTCVMDDHIQRIEKQAGRHVYVGVGAIRGWTEMKTQIDLAHDRAITGMSVYSFSQVDAIPNAWAQLAAGPFKNPATLPAMSWKN